MVAPDQKRADDPEWSSDGSSLFFTDHEQTPQGDTWTLNRLDLNTHRVYPVPGSQGMRGPAVSPDGKHLAATSTDPPDRLLLYEVQTLRWTELARAKWFHSSIFWSRDGQYIYAQDLEGVDQPIYRVRVSDHKMEVIATLKQFSRADATAFFLAGLTPKGEPLASLRRSASDIYALDVDFP
jgi:Tol biopolymer transport system component